MKLEILSAGSFTDERSAIPFLKAINLLPEKYKKKLSVKIIGLANLRDLQYIKKTDLNQIVEICPPLEKDELYSYYKSADILWFCISKSSSSDFVIPARIYEFLATKKPVIAIIDSKATEDFLCKFKQVKVFSPYSQKEICNFLKNYLDNKIAMYFTEYPVELLWKNLSKKLRDVLLKI